MIPLKRLLELPRLKCIRIVAGKDGLHREVSWTNTTETWKNIDFVHKNELVFTTGIYAHKKKNDLFMLVKSVYERGAAGIVLNLGPYITEISEEVIRFAEDHQFPVLSLPWEARITDLYFTICQYIMKAEGKESASQNLIKIEDLIRDFIFAGDNNLPDIAAIERYGYSDENSYCVLVCQLAEECSEKDKTSLCVKIGNSLAEKGYRQVFFIKEDKLIFSVLNKEEDGNETPKIGEIVSKSLEGQKIIPLKTAVLIGVGRFYKHFENLRCSYQEAMKVVGVKRNNPYAGSQPHEFEDLGIYKMFALLKDNTEPVQFYRKVLGKLEEFDQINSTQYMDFLRLYIEEDFSPTRVGTRLFMHRNTVLYKINRIKEILGRDLTSSRDKTDMAVALIIKDTM